ncbi:hypothetical protein UAJ10_21960 [Nitrospirillum sp. BR 11164]|uniref:hypothetical protein n=1 Tax=Nitrospirillum sp. BR 11164 TaxID=3104324 RepID=UPI002AFDCEE9|nr:hypothetical protein [Nitrospirillum sp. BR 11164]MEA1651667.1 hypothetical protein [Nitrospirillum sp. BR 11164]
MKNNRHRFLWRGLLAAAALTTVAACGSSRPERVDLSHSYRMVDERGRTAGQVVFYPAGGGAVYDADNNLIGSVAPPNSTTMAPPPAPVPRNYP